MENNMKFVQVGSNQQYSNQKSSTTPLNIYSI